MKYPQIINERATLTLMLMGASIARFGDGEWRCAVGGGCTSQAPDENLARELKQVLRAEGDHFIVGIPNVEGCPRAESWEKYTQPKFTDLLRKGPYHSSFITRPDNAPAIDTPDYWDMVRQLWRGQDIILVVGMAKDGSGPERKSITREMIEGEAKSVTVVIGPRQHAYAEIDRIEADIVSAAAQTSNPKTARVLLCLGTCATVLSWRLWKRGMHALDVGHIGMFLRHAGAYRYGADDVVSPKYRALLEKKHAQTRWGDDGKTHADEVRKLIERFKPETILDYGCGENTLAAALAPIRVSGYDPGIQERAKMPKPCDLVVCTYVLEHVEPEKVPTVLDHIYRLTGKVAYFCISKREAREILPDGRNAHLSIHDSAWWFDSLKCAGFARESMEVLVDVGKKLTVVAVK